jgi:16S rRNA G1207 methylase RsmC
VGEHYFAADPQVPSQPRVVHLRLDGRDLALTSDRGVFSYGRLDAGTGVLLREAPPPAGDVLVDLGCGYGPVACVLALRRPSATVWAVDVNPRARALTAANAAALGLADRVRPASPDEIGEDLQADEIWSNPPVRIGKAALHDLLAQWLPRLRPDGRAWLVVARNLGSDSLARWLAEQGWRVDRHASAQGYRVLRVRPRPVPGPSGVPPAF